MQSSLDKYMDVKYRLITLIGSILVTVWGLVSVKTGTSKILVIEANYIITFLGIFGTLLTYRFKKLKPQMVFHFVGMSIICLTFYVGYLNKNTYINALSTFSICVMVLIMSYRKTSLVLFTVTIIICYSFLSYPLGGNAIYPIEHFSVMILSATLLGGLSFWGRVVYTQRISEMSKEILDQKEKIIETQKIAGEIERLATIGEISSGIAHEINNPLSAIIGNAELIILTSNSELDSKKVDIIRDRAEKIIGVGGRIGDIIRSLKKIARKEAFDEPMSVNVKEVWDDAIEMIKSSYNNSNIRLEYDKASTIVPDIRGHIGEFTQIIIILLSNARDAVEKQNEIEKWVLCRTVYNPDKNCVEMSVINGGDKIDPDIVPRIMESFFTTKKSGKGTGMGLSIANNLAKVNNSTLEYKQKAPNTTFTLTVPVNVDMKPEN